MSESDSREARRLSVLQATGLLDSDAEAPFDRLTRLSSRLLDAPVALISLVDQHRQFFKSAVRLTEPWASRRETPLSYSFCQHVVRSAEKLVVADARRHPLLRDSPAITELNVIAYAGVPLTVDGETIGAFCVIDDKPRDWPPEKIELLQDLAASVVSEVQLRSALQAARKQKALIDDDGRVIGAVAAYRDVGDDKKEHQQFAALVGNIPNGAVALFDRDLRCLALEGGLLHGDDRATPSSVGKTLRELARFEPGDPAFDPVERICRQALEGGQGEEQIQRQSIDLRLGGRVFAVHAAPVRDQPGSAPPETGIVLALDVTHERALEKSLRQSEQIHRAIVQNLPLGAVFMMDADMRYVSADGPLLASLMREGEVSELVGRRVPDIVSDANRERLLAFYAKALAGERVETEIEYGERWLELSAVPIFEQDKVTNAVVVLHDVTARKREAETLRRARDEVARERGLLEAALGHIEDGMVLLDSQRRILLANASFAAMFSLQQETLTGMDRQTFVDWVAPVAEDPEAFATVMMGEINPEPQEFVFLRPRRRVLKRSLTSVRMGEGDGYLVTWHDVTAERDLLRERERLLLVDALTGIPNRRALETALHVEAERMKRTGTPFCVALLDVDHFKRVNDVHGHGAGDEVLRAVGGTLSSQARVTDTVGRWGGEEFLAVLNGTLSGARVFGERTRAAIEKLRCPPVERVTISIGLAELHPGESVLDAIARADKRLYDAKAGGRNRVCG